MLPDRLRLSKRDKLEKDLDIFINHIRAISKIAQITNDEYKLIIKNLCGNF